MDNSAKIIPHPAPEAEEVYRRWIQFLDDEYTRHQAPERRAEIVRDQLYQLYLGRPHGGKLNLTLTSELPGNVLSLSLDPENVTLEAEHFADADPEQFAMRKPLLWFWQMFDRSPIGTNHWLGLRFRAMLGRHLFARMGVGVRIYHGVDLTYGYNLSIGEAVTIRQRALLNDRGGITIGKGAVIGSFARVYSHIYAPDSNERVNLAPERASPVTPSCWPARASPPVKPSAASRTTASENPHFRFHAKRPPHGRPFSCIHSIS
jgi:acetyltransferase-like isoleucine patch superfamily enzyme